MLRFGFVGIERELSVQIGDEAPEPNDPSMGGDLYKNDRHRRHGPRADPSIAGDSYKNDDRHPHRHEGGGGNNQSVRGAEPRIRPRLEP